MPIVTTTDYSKKYPTDEALLAMDPWAVDSPDEIVWLSYRLDEASADAEFVMINMGDLEEMTPEQRAEYARVQRKYRTQRALKAALQQRRSNIQKERKSSLELRRANAFVDCARDFLSEDDGDFDAIWDMVYERHPDLRSGP